MQIVGEVLRVERERKSLTIKDVEVATSIRAMYLTAIEEANYSIVPGEVYLKGFIRNYANYVGLDGQQMVDLYRENQQEISAESSPQELIYEVNVPLVSTKQESLKKKVPTPSIPLKWLAIGAGVLCLAGVLWMLPTEQIFVDKPTSQPQTQVLPKTVTEVVPPASSEPVVVVAKFTEACWTLVSADGKKLYEGIPKAGETFTWEAKKNIVVKFGNAAGVTIVYNGQAVGKLGEKGEVIVKTFNAKI